MHILNLHIPYSLLPLYLTTNYEALTNDLASLLHLIISQEFLYNQPVQSTMFNLSKTAICHGYIKNREPYEYLLSRTLKCMGYKHVFIPLCPRVILGCSDVWSFQ